MDATSGIAARTVDTSRMVCHECDLLIAIPPLATGEKAYCPRCSYLLVANRPAAQETIFAFSVTGLWFLMLSSVFPFLGFSAKGQQHSVTLLQSVAVLITENFPSLAVIVFALIIAIPAAFLIGLIYVSTAIALRQRLPGTATVLRWVLLMLPWSMAEIFLIGILVSFIKILSIAEVMLGLSFWSYVLFSVCMTVVGLHLDKREIWHRVRALDDE